MSTTLSHWECLTQCLNRHFNKTEHSGLENQITNSYMNPLLQLLRFTPLVRNPALYHTAGYCIQDGCLLCEMGFLFDMLEKAGGEICQATNFLKAYSSLPEGKIHSSSLVPALNAEI